MTAPVTAEEKAERAELRLRKALFLLDGIKVDKDIREDHREHVAACKSKAGAKIPRPSKTEMTNEGMSFDVDSSLH